MRAHVVVDLGFGDAGKGLLTDALVRQTGARWVVRFNGGAQAGHNVVTPEGRHHTFAQFGAGSLVPGTGTLLSEHVAIHPGALLVEAAALEAKSVADPLSLLSIDARALVITPFHQAANRLRELARGDARHGSCGIGFGEAVGDARAGLEDALTYSELCDAPLAMRKARRAQERKRAELSQLRDATRDDPAAAGEWALLESPDVAAAWLDQTRALTRRVRPSPEGFLASLSREHSDVVFEGAQGVLLDEDAGFHPHTTYSRCGFDNALELLGGTSAEIRRIGVLRSHVVRHGAGPLPTECGELEAHVREHNARGPWQGEVRYGWFDAVLARYALSVCGGVDALVVTHLDLVSRLESWRLARRYAGVSELALPRTLEAQEALTRCLLTAEPLYATARGEEGALALIASELGRGVDLVSRGPTAADVSRL